MLLPLGLEDSKVDRIPIVCIVLALLNLLVFVAFMLRPDPYQARLEDAVRYWVQHPHLIPPEKLESRLPAELIGAVERLAERTATPPPVEVFTQQAELDKKVEELEEASTRSAAWKLGLVPARGLRQWGWLTSLFIHFGWMHLLGNLLFFYVTAPFIEDKWGRPLFAIFYLATGVFSSACHVMIDPSSQAVLGGASGAIAACLGAFAFRMARSRVRVLFWMLIIVRRFSLPGWIWSPLWFAGELLSLAMVGTSGGVAVMAHLGGWLAGFGFAVLMAILRVEEKYIEPALDRRLYKDAKMMPKRPLAPLRFGPLQLGVVVLAVGAGGVARFVPHRAEKHPTGTIRVTSDPGGAIIIVDGTPIPERTPFEITGVRLRKSTRIAVRMDGRKPSVPHQDVVLTSGAASQDLKFTLDPVLYFEVRSKPPGAGVFLDHRPLGQVPVKLPPLVAGQFADIDIVLEGYLPVHQHLIAAAGTATITQVQLEPSVIIPVATKPAGIRVLIDGIDRGPSPVEIEVARDRAFTLSLKKPGYRSIEKKLFGRAVGKKGLDLELQPLPFSALALTGEERRRAGELTLHIAELDARIRKSKVRLAQVRAAKSTHAARADIYSRMSAENADSDLEAEIESLEEERREAGTELENLRFSILDRAAH